MHGTTGTRGYKLGTLAFWQGWIDLAPIFDAHEGLLLGLAKGRPPPLNPASAGLGAHSQAKDIAAGPRHAQVHIEVVHQPMAKSVLGDHAVLHAERKNVYPGIDLLPKRLSIPMVGAAAVVIGELAGICKVEVHRLPGLVPVGDSKAPEVRQDGFKECFAQNPSRVDHGFGLLGVIAHATRRRCRTEHEISKNEVWGEACTRQSVVLGSESAALGFGDGNTKAWTEKVRGFMGLDISWVHSQF